MSLMADGLVQHDGLPVPVLLILWEDLYQSAQSAAKYLSAKLDACKLENRFH